jgi:amino acid transporter, AAT family
MFSGTRLMYSLSVSQQGPRFASRLNTRGVPYMALLATSSVSGLCFASSYIGRGELWGWLQNLVGVSNQVCPFIHREAMPLTCRSPQVAWLSIGVASYRFRKAWIQQGRSLDELKFQGARWTWRWGAPFVVSSFQLRGSRQLKGKQIVSVTFLIVGMIICRD